MTDEIPPHIDEEPRGLESDPLNSEPVPSAKTSKAMVMGLSVVAAVLAAYSGYELLQAKESQRLLDEANGKATMVETSRKNLESDLKKVRQEQAAALKSHEDAILKKDREVEEEKSRILQAHAEEAVAAVQAKVRLASDLGSLKSTNRELAKSMATVEAEVRRLTGEVASRKTSTSVSKPMQHPLSTAGRTVRQITSGPNKGRWHFVAPDGFRSPLYGSREAAVRDAELRARIGH